MIVSFGQQLDGVIDKYLFKFMNKRGFLQIHEETLHRGAYKDFRTENIFLRVISDFGHLALEIAPVHSQDKLRDFQFFVEYLQPPKQGALNLSLRTQIQFLDENWSWFVEHFREDGFEQMLSTVDSAARKRR